MSVYIYLLVSVCVCVCVGGVLPLWLSGKESACNEGTARDVSSIPGSGRSSGGGHGNPLQYSCLENPHGQRSLAGYSLGSQRLSMHVCMYVCTWVCVNV